MASALAENSPESLWREFGCREAYIFQLTALAKELLNAPGHLSHLSTHTHARTQAQRPMSDYAVLHVYVYILCGYCYDNIVFIHALHVSAKPYICSIGLKHPLIVV